MYNQPATTDNSISHTPLCQTLQRIKHLKHHPFNIKEAFGKTNTDAIINFFNTINLFIIKQFLNVTPYPMYIIMYKYF
jgi:hypothetical protein